MHWNKHAATGSLFQVAGHSWVLIEPWTRWEQLSPRTLCNVV
jgi:hypothetical protein